ncbi:MAG: hypothetical protein KJO25_08450 [Bacteroidia bacterium]|nr:hypothetical protein [Bacteroidia bacterium]
MKNIFRTYLVLALIGLVIYSCTESDNTIDGLFDDITNGAVLRTINESGNDFVVGVGSVFTLEVEEQDNQEGALLESVDVYVRFNDNTVLSANSASGAGTDESFPADGDVLLRNVPASEFSPGPFGLPRTTITISEADLAAALPTGEFDSLDTVEVRLSLNLTDGRVFSNFNAGGIITGGFFNSPFLYLLEVNSGIGINYLTENRNSFVVVPGFDNTYAVEAELTDQSDGDNIAGLEVYRRFVDNTPENGDNSTTEELLLTFGSADFSTSADGFPVADVTLTEAELLGSLTAADISIGDEIFVRYSVTTVDGRTVTNESADSNFYDSVLVTDCPFPALNDTQLDLFVGDYLVEWITSGIFGYDTWDPDGGGVVLTLFSGEIDATQFSAGTPLEDNQRSFDADYLAVLGGGNFRSYILEFGICTVTVAEDAGPIGGFSGWTCGAEALLTGPVEDAGSYDASDDSFFLMQYEDDIFDDCGIGGTFPLTSWTKQ